MPTEISGCNKFFTVVWVLYWSQKEDLPTSQLLVLWAHLRQASTSQLELSAAPILGFSDSFLAKIPPLSTPSVAYTLLVIKCSWSAQLTFNSLSRSCVSVKCSWSWGKWFKFLSSLWLVIRSFLMFGGEEILVWVNLRIKVFQKWWYFNGDGGISLFGAGEWAILLYLPRKRRNPSPWGPTPRPDRIVGWFFYI